MQRRTAIGVLVFVLLASGVGYGAWRWVSARDEHVCTACSRVIHAASRVKTSDGRAFCCPACALAEKELSHGALAITELTDFATGRPLEPSVAVIVRGSDVNPCMQPAGAVNEDKRPLNVMYDRCAPSLIAFASRGAADEFARQHGGAVVPFTSLDRP